MTLTTTRLAGHRTLVQGSDILGVHGKQILDSAEWDEIAATKQHTELHDEFDAKVKEFFAPIMEAADALHEAHKVQTDPAFYLVLDEGEEATPGRPEQVVALSHDSVVLRLLEQGAYNRLVWVNDSLEILEQGASAPSFEVTEDGDPTDVTPAE